MNMGIGFNSGASVQSTTSGLRKLSLNSKFYLSFLTFIAASQGGTFASRTLPNAMGSNISPNMGVGGHAAAHQLGLGP